MDLPRIAKPCHEPWDAMTPAGAGRHCASCDLTVVDLTAMPRAEARRWIERQAREGGRACVRAPRGRDGAIALPPPKRARLLTNALAGMLAMAAAGCSGVPDAVPAPEQPGTELAGTEPEPLPEAKPAPEAPGLPIMGAAVAQPEPVEPPSIMGDMVAPPPRQLMGRIRVDPPEPVPVAEPAAPQANT